ncbi:DUF4879 domain-containing protein [Helicobacter sp. UBA3407]|uniref:DUF4879 domain-containing protein n=1 Tax=Helicobacter sp. UBA3407 TaxID=1946588 RepID=UPI002631EF5D|nr:DUF4879 domain-containing protein [Helicobacter sp. UBA3407]
MRQIKTIKQSKLQLLLYQKWALWRFALNSKWGNFKYGCENIQDNQTSTNFNHGGNPFQVVTGVAGYGGRNTDSATFAGNQATMIDCVGIAGSDNVVFGWWEWWDISKPSNSSGEFVYTARSINVGPTMSTSIYIK